MMMIELSAKSKKLLEELTEEELYELMELMKGVGKYDLSQLTEEDLIYLLEIIAKRKASSLTKQDLKKTNNPDRK